MGRSAERNRPKMLEAPAHRRKALRVGAAGPARRRHGTDVDPGSPPRRGARGEIRDESERDRVFATRSVPRGSLLPLRHVGARDATRRRRLRPRDGARVPAADGLRRRASGHCRRARGHGRQSPRRWYQADFGLRRVPTRVHAPDWRGSAVRGPRRGGDRPVARRASRRIRLDARSCSPGNIGRRWSLRPSRGSHGPRLVRASGRGAVRRDGRGFGRAPLVDVSARSLLTTGSRYISVNCSN